MFMKRYRDIIYLLVIFIMGGFLYYQYDITNNLNFEKDRIENNIIALTDTIKTYRNKNGLLEHEKHAYQLSEKELKEHVQFLEDKNRKILSYTNSNVEIKDIIVSPTLVEHVQIDSVEHGTISFSENKTFGKSYRNIDVSIPYIYNDSLFMGDAHVQLEQNIYVESILEKEKNETYIRFITDYPNVRFDGDGVVVVDKPYIKPKRMGFTIGPSVGVGYDFINRKIVPTVGVNLTWGWRF